MKPPIILLASIAIFIMFGLASAKPTLVDGQEKASTLLESTIKALGGNSYLNIKNEHAKGIVTPYREIGDGSQVQPDKAALLTFNYNFLSPDKERIDFKSKGRHFVQTNAEPFHWTYDSDSQILKDQPPAQRQRYLNELRFHLDQILRGGWRSEGVKLDYLAKQEIWPRQFAEGVKITFVDGAAVELFVDPQNFLPLALRFPRINIKGEMVKGENRFFKYLEQEGVKVAYVIDLYENGVQSLRINYDQREFNVQIAEKIFIKPENVKEIK